MNQTTNKIADAQILALKQQIQVLRQRLPFYQLEREARLAQVAHSFERHNQRPQQEWLPQICLAQIDKSAQLESILTLCADFPTLMIDLGSNASEPNLSQAYQELSLIRKRLPQHFLIVTDQIVDDYQILRARLAGADGLILDLSDLGYNRSKTYCNKVHLWGMEPIMKVKQIAELEALSGLPTRSVWLDPCDENERACLLQSHLLTSFFWSGLSLHDSLPAQRPPTQHLVASCSLWQQPEPLKRLDYLQTFYQQP